MADKTVDKEDVIEDQNDKLEDEHKTIEDKEDVIEDQNDTIKGDDDSVLKILSELTDTMRDFKSELIAIKDGIALFAENGGVIREDINDFSDDDNDSDDDYVPIEELDLNM